MRDNAAALDKLAAEAAAQSRKGMTALEDMQTLCPLRAGARRRGEALVASFTALYDMMPDEQKKLADQVFQRNRRRQGTVRAGSARRCRRSGRRRRTPSQGRGMPPIRQPRLTFPAPNIMFPPNQRTYGA